MGRRWVVQVDTSENGHPLYLRQFSFFAGQRGHPADTVEWAKTAADQVLDTSGYLLIPEEP
jgi:hypothetical protein